MLRLQMSKRRKEDGHKRRKAQSGIVQYGCGCQSNQCCSNLGAIREKTQARVSHRIAICMFPNLTHARSWALVYPNLQYKREACTTQKGGNGIIIRIITKERRRRSELESVVSATLKNRAEVFGICLSPCSTYNYLLSLIVLMYPVINILIFIFLIQNMN